MVPPVKQQEIWLEYMQRKGDKSKKKAVYIHIPFCSQICLYCGFSRIILMKNAKPCM